MRRLLELTGRQGTLDEFRVARAKYGEARTLHREARQQFEQKKLGLAQLQSKLRQYREWGALGEKLQAINGFLLPAARHFAAVEELEAATGSFSPKQEEVTALKTAAAEDRKAADARKAEIPDLEREHEELGGQEKRLSTVAREAAVQLGRAGEQARQAWREFDAAWAVAGRASQEKAIAAVESAEMALSACLRARHAAEAEIATLQEDLERFLAGGGAAPAVVRAFHEQLRETGIEAIVVGDVLAGTAGDATGPLTPRRRSGMRSGPSSCRPRTTSVHASWRLLKASRGRLPPQEPEARRARSSSPVTTAGSARCSPRWTPCRLPAAAKQPA
jgi:hypothetical protein